MTSKKHQSTLLQKILFFVLIAFFVILGSWQILNGSIVFHTDIARDFLLLEDILITKKPALIGPRSGGIPGVFHGPLWLYVNLPVFVLSHGNPLASGWFWIFLFLLGLWSTYQVGKKLFSEKVGLTSALLVAISTAGSIPSLFNPFGAVIVSPICFYFLLLYLEKHRARDLTLYLFFTGIVIQFQMAYGGPILLISSVFIVKEILKKRNFIHMLCFLILLLPLSTFIAFDLRHQFLQTKSVLNYLKGVENMGKLKIPFPLFFLIRVKEMIVSGTGLFVRSNIFIAIGAFVFYLYSFFKLFRSSSQSKKQIGVLFLAFYVGYWVLTLAFKGTIWSYYYWPFLPLVAIVTSYFIWEQQKKVAVGIILAVVVFNGFFSVKEIAQKKGEYLKTGSWLFYYDQAKKIYSDAPDTFGYYIYTADQFGYSSRYAMDYGQKQFSQKKAVPYEKKETTYLIVFPSSNPYTSEHWWKKNQVKIDRKPDEVFRFSDGSYIEKYQLSKEEQAVTSDQNLIHSLIFR